MGPCLTNKKAIQRDLINSPRSDHSSIVEVGQTLLGMVFPDFIFIFYKGQAKDKNRNAKNYLKVSRRKVCLGVSSSEKENGTG